MNRKLLALLLGLSLVLGACRSAAPATPAVTQTDPNAVLTAAASTASARMTEIVAQTPSPQPATPTAIQAPATATLQPATSIPVTTTATTAPALGTNPAPTGDRAEFVTDVTVPDGTNFQPNATFVKTWQLQNSGTTTWTTAYSLVFASGASMGGPASVPMPSEVAPGQSVDISVNLTAPADPGTYRGYWNLKNASGQLFGLGPSANEPIWVDIVVGSGGATTPAATSAAGASTPGATGSAVTSASISVDNASVTGACPHTFTFTSQFSLSQAATVSYRLDAGSDNTSFPINVPEATTTSLDAGTHTLVYTLDFSNSLNGWARLHVTAPNDVVSNQASFSLTCQ